MSCANGVLERIIYSVVAACAADEKEECNIISNIILANLNLLIPQYILDWYKLHKRGSEGEFPAGTDKNTIKLNLKQYLKELLPEYTFAGIDPLINQYVEETEVGVGFDEDVFEYGGRKRKTKKAKFKTNNRTKKKKVKIKKVKNKETTKLTRNIRIGRQKVNKILHQVNPMTTFVYMFLFYHPRI